MSTGIKQKVMQRTNIYTVPL